MGTADRAECVEAARQAVEAGQLPAIPETLKGMLRWAIASESTYPSRPELDRRLKKIESAARYLTNELADLRMQALLLNGEDWIQNENELHHGLADVAARAARVRSENPRRKGRGQLYPSASNGPNAKELCALIVASAIHQKSGRRPGKANSKAQSACEALWTDVDGPARAGFVVASWSAHLKAAQNYWPPHPAGSHIQRILCRAVSDRPAGDDGRFLKLLRKLHKVGAEHAMEDNGCEEVGVEGVGKRPV